MLYIWAFICLGLLIYSLLFPKQRLTQQGMLMMLALTGATVFFTYYLTRVNFSYTYQLQTFGVSRRMWLRLALSRFDCRYIVLFYNICCAVFLFTQLRFAVLVADIAEKPIAKRTVAAAFLTMVAEVVIFDPITLQSLYYMAYPHFVQPPQWNRLLYVSQNLFCVLNWVIMLSGVAMILYSLGKHVSIRTIRVRKSFVSLLYIITLLIFAVNFGRFPTIFTRYQKLTGEIQYLTFRPALRLGANPLFALYLLAFSVLFLIVMIMYTHYLWTLYIKDSTFKRRYDSAATTARMFCHYIKNEIITLQALVSEETLQIDEENIRDVVEKIRRCLDTIYQHMDIVHTRLNDHNMVMRRYPVRKLITEMCDEVGRSLSDVTIRVRVPSSSFFILADSYYLTEALTQLLYNAYDAMEYLPVAERIIEVECERAMQHLVFIVRDHGRGMKRYHEKELFSPFISTKPSSQHWGLGLSICYSIIKAHDGRILIQSKEGQGTTVSVVLPDVTENQDSGTSEFRLPCFFRHDRKVRK